MQVKKFEAPTMQEALENVKRELGPEAIILQTKKNRRGFGLMSRESVEITAAVSERSLHKKEFVDKRLPDATKAKVKNLPATRQAEFIDKYAEKHTTKKRESSNAAVDLLLNGRAQDQVQMSSRAQAPAQASTKKAAAPAKKITATRYADIDQHEIVGRSEQRQQATQSRNAINEAALTQLTQQSSAKMSLEEELRHLKRMIEEVKIGQDQQGQPQGSRGSAGVIAQQPSLNEAFEQLILNGMDKRYAYSLIKQVAFELGDDRAKNPDEVLDQLAAEIMQSTEIRSPLGETTARKENTEGKAGGPVVIALVGPTGVGKTTTVAKMASDALLKRNLRVGLINLDGYKVAAFDQLGTYAKILNVPFRSCATGEDLRAAIQDFQSLDLVLVDTTGRSQRDPNSLKEMQNTLNHIPQLRTQLVLSVTTRDSELYDMANRFSMFRPQGIIVSKLDEATIYGAIYNVSQKVKLPLLYFTTGQRVPEDIEEASKERVAALILDI